MTSSSPTSHERTRSASVLASIASVIPTTLFSSPKLASQAVFLDEEEGKLGESGRAGSSQGLTEGLRRVELKVGGMTVSMIIVD